ncbi:mdn1 midasin family protein [Nannochloropsis gaditana]|uniref:Midasin n=1 Tax=Nannochloropsis gaditana TaxID=72520 RepID=W7U6I2_9STRA|nr:mdn1 midasin family protein [Nannochloropsis gaditana]
MNPANDAGKKELPPALRARFTEVEVTELVDPQDLRAVVERAWSARGGGGGKGGCGVDPIDLVQLYLRCRQLAESVLVDGPFWLPSGPLPLRDWNQEEGSGGPGTKRFILTPSARLALRGLARAVAGGHGAPILLQGPTSAGKTTLVEYLAARTGHVCVRINNHEHTDVSEYTGAYAPDPITGHLRFQDGLLVKALREGAWLILDELNLAPPEVLEGLNRLLDDNRELLVPETQEIIVPHPAFRLFATQNPPGGAYGGRKPLSRAFRNRFLELDMGPIAAEEMEQILHERVGMAPSHARLLVKVMATLQGRRTRSMRGP